MLVTKWSTHTYDMTLCAGILSAAIMVGYLARVTTNVAVHETIQHGGLTNSIITEKPNQPITSSFVMRIHSEYVIKCSFQVKWFSECLSLNNTVEVYN